MYSSPKVIYAKLAKRPEAALDAKGEYAALNVNCFYSPRPDVSLKLIAAFSNSAVFHFLYRQFFGALGMSTSLQFQAPQLRAIPFKLPSARIRSDIEIYVDEMMQDRGKIAEISERIDDLFFEAYRLTDHEIHELMDSISR